MQNTSTTLLALNQALANIKSSLGAEDVATQFHYYQWLLLPAILLLLFSIFYLPTPTNTTP
jgi:hypothetical protein